MVVPSKKLQKYLTDRPSGKLGWVLKRNAPDDVRKEYKEYKAALRAINGKE